MNAQEFVEKYQFLIGFYAIDFITQSYWNDFPIEFKEMEYWELSEISGLFNGQTPHRIPALDEFMSNIKLLTVPRIPKNLPIKEFNRDILLVSIVLNRV